jgi:UDP-arabinose 4-epimerase
LSGLVLGDSPNAEPPPISGREAYLQTRSASRSSEEWRDDDYDVLAYGVVVGRIFTSLPPSAPRSPRQNAHVELLLSMKRILVTGGAGFVGSHACKALARAGYIPITFDSLERGHVWAVKWGPLERGDLREESDLRQVFEAWRPWAVMHFAALAYVGESTIEPIRYYDTNIGGTAKLLKACEAFGCKNIVFSSSCAIYGVPAHLPLAEGDAQRPINPYGYTKVVVERMLRDVEAAHGIRHVALRYFNAAGADPDGELGELHEPETHLIPLALLAAMSRRPSIKIFGNDYPTADGRVSVTTYT